ncbi:MAG: hypothetical protein ACYC27_00040 [Armatimonadota bacterium]
MCKFRVQQLVFTLIIFTFLTVFTEAADRKSNEDSIWIGPHAFVSDRTLRSDYFSTLTDEKKWPSVLKEADVWKSYIMILPNDPVPNKGKPELSDRQLKTLIRFLKKHNLKTAFEVGGVRSIEGVPNTELGETTAKHELTHLRRWKGAGGSIDYITTDHAVMMNLGSPYVQPDQFKHRGLTLDKVIEEQADYFEIFHKEFPKTKLGAIESLGFFHVKNSKGKEYSRTVPALPVWNFEDYINKLIAAMNRRGLKLDHFHIDYGYEGVFYDGGSKGELDFGRISAIESHLHSRGVKSGVIVNAFHDTSVKDPSSEIASKEACERTLKFYDGYVKAGGNPNHLVIQTWQQFPDRTGPETDPLTVLGLARSILDIRNKSTK